jgi:hypothetical protein
MCWDCRLQRSSHRHGSCPSAVSTSKPEIRNQYPPAFHHGVHHGPHHTRRKTCPCPSQYRRLLYHQFLKQISHRRALGVPRTKHPAGLRPAARLVSLANAGTGTGTWVGFFHSHTRMPMPMQAASQTNKLLTNQQINTSFSVPHYMLHLPTCRLPSPYHTTPIRESPPYGCPPSLCQTSSRTTAYPAVPAGASSSPR